MSDVFVDANVIVYYQDTTSPFCQRATEVLESLIDEGHRGIITPWVINEIHYLYLRAKGQEKAKKVIESMLKIPSLELVDMSLSIQDIKGVIAMAAKYRLKTFDAFHAYYCKRLKIKEIASFDRDFERVAGLGYYES